MLKKLEEVVTGDNSGGNDIHKVAHFDLLGCVVSKNMNIFEIFPSSPTTAKIAIISYAMLHT